MAAGVRSRHHGADMSKPAIIGFPQSTYVWTARAALGLKGVDYEFRPFAPPANRQPEHLARHPWGKVPAFEHGDVSLYETAAICDYVDTAFEGPALVPSGASERARARQIASICDCYLYPPGVVRYALQYIFPSGPDGAPNRETIDAAVPEIGKTLGVLADALGDKPWFVGDGPTIADLYVGPLIAVLGMFPEGKGLVGANPNLAGLLGRLMEVPAFRDAAPRG